jgi:ribokinase
VKRTTPNSELSLIVIGEMNTDIIVSGLPRFPKPGELINGTNLSIGPGGKSRNIAAMAGTLMPRGQVAMVSKTVQDKYGLWEEPLAALEQCGVDTNFVQILPEDEATEFPGIALILVNRQGTNEIIGAPGITRLFDKADIDTADALFATVAHNHGILAFIGNCPPQTAQHAVSKANHLGIKVVFDPGGADNLQDLTTLLTSNIYLFKPNIHEATALTGHPVTDFDSAREAAAIFMHQGVHNVLITHGAKGAYLFTRSTEKHIPIPKLLPSATKDETGCGDQTMATVCAYLLAGQPLEKAAEIAVIAGTLQFYKAGIQPITPQELGQP